jgi:hypothetical protein
MAKTIVLIGVLLITAFVSRAADGPKIDNIAMDPIDHRLVLVHFDDPTPSVGDIQRSDYWTVYSKGPRGIRKHTVVGVDVSLFHEEHTIVLQLMGSLSDDWENLDVSLVNDKSILHVDPDVVTKPNVGQGQATAPFEGTTSRDDSDIYFSGSYTGVVDGDPVWDIDAFAGYMKAIQSKSRYWGKIGFYGQIKTNASATADPDSFLAYGVYQRVIGRGWLGPFQAPYINYRFSGWEFDREGKQLNFVTSPVLTIPMRLSGRLAGPVEPGLTFPHMTFQLGTEFVNVWKSPLAEAKNWRTRGLLGITFSTGYAPEANGLHSILFTSSYQVRLPSSPEIFYDDRFAPVDQTTGKKGDTPPMLGTQARHSIDTTVTYMFLKWAGVSFEHTYGSLPPAFDLTGHSFKVGLAFSLKQTSFGRYSILRP